MSRSSWKSQLGFIFAAAGSAVGLANIWRFPYVVGQYGGAAFVCIYLVCLFLIGFPVFISEILIGKSTQKNPSKAFQQLGKNVFWQKSGLMTIVTGFLISAFYSVIASWVLGYLIKALLGHLNHFASLDGASSAFSQLVSTPIWTFFLHLLFIGSCCLLLLLGVRKGLENGSKWMVPFLILILLFLALIGVTLPGSEKGLSFYLKPNWSLITPTSVLIALGHSFFTLSLGQGTMVTYGSYLSHNESIPKNCLPIALLDTGIALLAGFALFPFVFSVGLCPSEGPALIFETLPLVFSQLSGGYLLTVLFFLLLLLAALTSEISALEPLIAYLIDEKKWPRKKAVCLVCLGAFLLGLPILFSNFVFCKFKLFNMNLFDLTSRVCLDFLVPIGGFLGVILVGWKWGVKKALDHLQKGSQKLFEQFPVLRFYFKISIKYLAPCLILLIFIHSLISHLN